MKRQVFSSFFVIFIAFVCNDFTECRVDRSLSVNKGQSGLLLLDTDDLLGNAGNEGLITNNSTAPVSTFIGATSTVKPSSTLSLGSVHGHDEPDQVQRPFFQR
jgi:hypothetical protein